MAYFTYTEDSLHYPGEWQNLLNYIKNEWPSDDAAHLGDLSHHIEVKALFVLTMSRHLIDKAKILATKSGGWKPVFVEASILLFPMIELIGEARLGSNQDNRLGGGIDWLIDPFSFPKSRTNNDLKTEGWFNYELK